MSVNAGQSEPLTPSSSSDGLERSLADVACEAFWERDIGSEAVRWIGDLPSIFGYPRAEVLDELGWWRERIHPDDIERVEEALRYAIAGNASGFSSEYRFRRVDGSWAWVASRSVILRDAGGKARRELGAMLDVSKLKGLWESRELLRTVLATLPVGAVVLDEAGNVSLTNPATERIWGRLIVSGRERWQRSTGFWHESGARVEPEDWASVRALRHGQTSSNELIDIETFDGQRKVVENSAAPLRDAEGRIAGAVAVIEDVTDRVRAEEMVRRVQRLLLDAERLGQTGSWEMDLVSGEIFNSDASRSLFFGDDTTRGARLEDYAEAIHRDDRDRVMRSREAMLAGTGPSDIEYRVVWPDGSVHVIYARATVVRDDTGRAIRVYGTNADITERKRTEVELARRAQQLQSLSRKLIQAQEAERRTLSNELHDDLGQLLFALKLNLEKGGQRDSESMTLVEGAIARMRDLVQALRPPLLDELGLKASLRWHVEREAARVGLAFNLALESLEKRPPVTVEITCFRVAQEALSNVIRHAQAKTVDIELRTGGGTLLLTVRDDGRGFDVDLARARATTGSSQGLLSMEERVALVDGELEIESAPGRGTAVRARLPLSPNARR